MARRLSADDHNTIRMTDHLSDTEIELYYRMPTTRERVGFASMAMTRKNGKLVNNRTEARVKYGADILKGVRQGDFEVKRDGVYVPLSSDTESEYFDADWRSKLKSMAPDILELLAIRVFEASVALAETPDDDPDEPETASSNTGETPDQD